MSDPLLSRLRTRKELAADPAFAVLFSDARRAVSRMEARYMEVGEPELRTVFEVYASMLLETENSFETH